MIEIKNLVKSVKKKVILNNINISISRGEKIAIVGGNGAGKTTLIETILGIQSKTSGEINFNFDYKKSPLEKVGVQFQDSDFPVGLDVTSLLGFFMEKSLTPDYEYLYYLIDKFGVNEFCDTDASKLSGGQAQKINIILALISKPEILFLDELTTGLDVFTKNILIDEVEEYINKRKPTLILISHTPHEIERLVDRVIVLDKGRLVEDSKVKRIVIKYGSVGKFLDTLH